MMDQSARHASQGCHVHVGCRTVCVRGLRYAHPTRTHQRQGSTRVTSDDASAVDAVLLARKMGSCLLLSPPRRGNDNRQQRNDFFVPSSLYTSQRGATLLQSPLPCLRTGEYAGDRPRAEQPVPIMHREDETNETREWNSVHYLHHIGFELRAMPISYDCYASCLLFAWLPELPAHGWLPATPKGSTRFVLYAGLALLLRLACAPCTVRTCVSTLRGWRTWPLFERG